MKVSIECMYCGHKWTEIVYHKSALDDKTCPHGTCRDKNLIIRDVKDKVDTYKGCPPFPDKAVEDKWRSFGID